MIKKVSSENDILVVEKLAHKIWNSHYTPIIGQQQVDYMLQKYQNFEAIKTQIKNGYHYYTITNNKNAIGYLSLLFNEEEHKLMISKIYVDADQRGTGYGSQLIEFTKKIAKEKSAHTIWLTVNKYNSNSIQWYEKMNFKITNEIVMDIGNNYVMDDYVMELNLP